MFMTIVRKELQTLFHSPRFLILFGVCSLLILLSVHVGINEYEVSVQQYDAARTLVSQQLQEKRSWSSFDTMVYREPDPLQVFVTGVQNDVGRLADITPREAAALRRSIYSDDPLFAVFRHFDFVLIVQIVLALFAILFTYDAINGEREAGTLKLALANPVPRATWVAAKFTGAWLGVLVPFSLPILLGVLLVELQGVPLTAAHWPKLLAVLGVSGLYITFFVAGGLMISTFTRRPAVSFLISLVAWVIFVLILPRVGLMAATQLSPVPSVAELKGQQDTFAKDRWDRYLDQLSEVMRERSRLTAGLSPAERDRYEDEHMWEWLQEDEARRKVVEAEIEAHNTRLWEDLRNRKQRQEQLAYTLTRFSPASLYQLAVMNLAGTDVDLKHRYEEALGRYREEVTAYAEARAAETGDSNMFTITVRDGKVNFQRPRDRGSIDTSGLPRFQPPEHAFAAALDRSLLDGGLLILFTLGAFALGFTAFLRYDPR
jgi:ABC-type transport system involved in multi-copper enzyme maturation permease subunit